MKKIHRLILLPFAFLCVTSCDDGEVQMEQVHMYNDSIPTVVPSISTIQTRIDQNVDVKLIVGSTDLYDAPPARMSDAAIKAGQMALRIFGTGIKSGTLIVTKVLQNHPEDPADGIKTDMKIDSLKKAAEKK